MPSDLSAILALPYLMPAQAQKHVTHNEALRILDVAVQLAVQDRDRSAPPAGPQEGQRHIVAAGASGDWAGHAGAVAAFLDGGWSFFPPRPGWRAEVLDEGQAVVWDGAAWIAQAGLAQVVSLGVNTSADAFNRLAVAAPATLLTHEGAGHQLKLNKAAVGETASLLFQSDWTGYAEMGLAGDNNFAIKVSDGTTWQTPLAFDAAARTVAVAGVLDVAVDAPSGPAMLLRRASTDPGTGVSIRAVRAKGTPASPEALTDGTVIMQLAGNGHDGSGFSPVVGALALKAAQDWAPGKCATRFSLELAAPDAASRREVLAVEADGRALLEGKALYHQGNLLGAVGQTLGVPTGAAIERGSSGNGEYVKFADGTLICTAKKTLVYYGGAELRVYWTFPAAFAAVPSVSQTADLGSASLTPVRTQLGIYGIMDLSASGVRFVQNRISGGANFGAADTMDLHVVATGRWF